MDIYKEIVRIREAGGPAALATIIESVGSTPRKAGSKMVVRGDGSIAGSIGGGHLEARVCKEARSAMKEGSPRLLSVDLTEGPDGTECGGKVKVFVEPIETEPHLVILGAGHVGRALSTAGRFAGFRVTVYDDRPDYATPETLPDAREVIVGAFAQAFSVVRAGAGTAVVVATRSHDQDFEGVKAALQTDAGYIGLLGSSRKKKVLFGKLREAGFSEEALSRVITPVGLSIGAVTPEEIAISVVAQLVAHRRSCET